MGGGAEASPGMLKRLVEASLMKNTISLPFSTMLWVHSVFLWTNITTRWERKVSLVTVVATVALTVCCWKKSKTQRMTSHTDDELYSFCTVSTSWTISKALNSSESHYSQMDKTAVNLPRSGQPHPGGHKRTQNDIKELQASLGSVTGSVHDSTIWNRLEKNDIHERDLRRKHLLTKKKTKAHLTFVNKHLNDPQDFWENILWPDKTKVPIYLNSIEMVCMTLGLPFILYNYFFTQG